MKKLFEARAVVLECHAKQRLVEKEIELEHLKQKTKREWAWLTKEDVDQAWGDGEVRGLSRYDIARAIEAKLKEKNT